MAKRPQFNDPIKEKASRHLRAADDLVRRKQYDDALLEVERAYKLDPKNLYTRAFLERIHYLIDKATEERSKEFGESNMLIERRMESISRLLASAEDFIKQKNYHAALAAVAKVYKIDPTNYYAQIFSGRIDALMQAESAGVSMIPVVPLPPIPADAPAAAPPSEPAGAVPETSELPGDSAAAADSSETLTTEPEAIPPPMFVHTPEPEPTPEPAPQAPPAEYTIEPELPEEAGRLVMYRELLKECWADGVITKEEESMLNRVRSQYSITQDDHRRIEAEIKIDAYVDALRIIWRDGVVTDNEQEVLEAMRKTYGISPEEREAAERKFAQNRDAKQTTDVILIVDSDYDDLMSTARALINQGYDVKISHNPDDALKFLLVHTPSLILSEVTFPGVEMDGFELFRRVRSSEHLAQIPFLMMTYPEDVRIVRAGLRMGVDYFISKPLHIDLVVAVVEGKLKSGRQGTQPR